MKILKSHQGIKPAYGSCVEQLCSPDKTDRGRIEGGGRDKGENLINGNLFNEREKSPAVFVGVFFSIHILFSVNLQFL